MAYRSSSSTSFATATALTATAPAGVVAGDRLLAFVIVDGQTGPGTAPGNTITPATGWTELLNADQNNPDSQTVRLLEKKVATGSDLYNFVTSPGGTQAVVQVVCLSGRHATQAAVTASTTNTTSNATPISVSMTGVTALQDDDVVWFCALDQTVAADTWGFSAVAGYTERLDVATGNFLTVATDTADAVSAGATGALTSTATRATGTGNAGYGGFVVAVPQAPPPYTVASSGNTPTFEHPALRDPPLGTRELLDVRMW